jgi:S1-C subfamily serine protease
MRIGSPAGQTFDFDSLFGNLGVRPGLTPLPVGGADKIRTDVFGVRARPATEAEGGQGLYVHSTEPATIANLLGIARGDVLLEVNGRALSTLEDVTTALGQRGPDGRVEAVWRDGAGRRRTGSWRP